MSLGTRLALKTVAIVAALIALAAVAWWGVNGLNRDLDAALDEYDQLAQVYELAFTVERARVVLLAQPGNPQRVRPTVMRARLELEEESIRLRPELVEKLRQDLKRAYDSLDDTDTGPTSGALNTAINRLFAEAQAIKQRIQDIGAAADQRRARVTAWVTGSAVTAIVLVIGVGFWQYLAVMRPLRRLERGVKRLASGDFTQQLEGTGDREFARLADDFNRMAEQLRELYDSLEQKVRVRSAQLAQSERLASVGFLAAGVAHEINNPLAIIAGEAELTLQGCGEDEQDKRSSLTTIRDEAFRCKAITQKLISLARPGSGVREPVDLLALACELAGLTRTLPQYEGKQLEVVGDPASVVSNAAQIKQVLLNLTINALEATTPGHRVTLAVSGDEGWARVRVIDRGRGMNELTLEKVFEPFYTEKQSPSSPGLGLGLSISHVIVEDLGGRLSASSAGPGQGSTFTIELPAVESSKDQA